MTRHARQRDSLPRRQAEAPRRDELQPSARESQPPERVAQSLSPAPLTRDVFVLSAVGNGRVANDLAANPDTRVAPDGAGNGVQVIYLEPLVITARDPNEPGAGDIADAEEAYAIDMAERPEPESVDTEAREVAAPEPQPPPAPQTAEPAAIPAPAAQATSSPRTSPDTQEEVAAPSEEEVESEAASQEAAAEEVAEEEAAAIEMEPEIIEMEPEVIEARTPARARGDGGGGGGDPRVVVQRWRGGVSQASSAIPRPTMGAVSGGPGQIRAGADRANTARRGIREGLPEEAAANIEVPPQVEEPPAPPASNPIPEHTSAIEAASDKRLPDAQLPLFVQTPVRNVTPEMNIGGNWPRLGQRAVLNQLFELLAAEGREDLAQIPPVQEDPERAALEHARGMLNAPIEVGAQIGEGERAPLVDAGPQPIAPLPEGMATPVAAVVTRLLASMDSATSDVMTRLRRLVFPTLKVSDYYPDLGDAAVKGQIGGRMNTELREIAVAAGVGGDELDRMVAERKRDLEKEAADAQQQICASQEEATESVSEGGQETLNAIEGARQSTDEQLIERQEAASGGNDPSVINARRDLVIRWIRNHVTTQTTNYQKAGEKRERDLNDGKTQRIGAYNALAQREEYQMLHPRPPRPAHDRTQPEVVRHLDDLVADIRAWTRERVQDVETFVRPFLATARDTTREYRSAVETAGTEGIDAARTWAEDRVLEGESWWERFKARLERWFGDSQQANEQWYVRRTEETRNAIAGDLTTIGGIQTAVARGATREQLLQTQGLTAEQRAIIVEYFEQPAGTHPLDFAATLLRKRLAAQYVEMARPAFESELLSKPDDDHTNLTELAKSNNRSFDAARTSQTIHAQLDNFDSDEAAMLRSLEGLSAFEGAIVRKAYRSMWGIDMDFAMSQAFDSDEMDQARMRLEGKQAAADAAALDDAMGLINTDESAIVELLRGRSQEEIDAVRAEYRRRFGKELDVALQDNLDEGNEQDQAAALLRGDRETADAIAIDEAMRGGSGWGTDEEEIEATYKRVHDEVLAQAQREGWTSQQMQAEIRRRTQRIESSFSERYADVEEYQAPGLEGETVFRRAISSEMAPGPERDLANALASNDMVAADAARIEIERRGLWASDEAINNVLTNQYERALEETRLDEGPARQIRVDRLRRQLSAPGLRLTEEEISVRVIALERQMENEMGEEAQRRSNISMETLTRAYGENYTYPLWYVLETSMSGVDREKARALHAQGGRLSALQTVEYASEGAGTDEDALRNRIGNMTRAEIQQLRRDWEARHPGESFDDMLRGELSGRDESDIMDMVEHGAPESASKRIDQERRRTQRELDELTGVLGGAAAGREEAWLHEQMRRLDELEPDLYRRDLSEEEREELREDLDFRIERVQAAVEDHRRAIDSVANFAAQVASLAVAITVGAVLTAVSGGALGPVMIAVIAAVAATITTMGTKALIQGGSYGAEDIGVDLAVGVVDALTAAATAGMGGRILRGATGAAQAAARPTQVTRLLGGLGRTGVAQRVARSRAGQVVGRAAARANQAQSGFLTRGIQGQNILARMARGDNNKALRILAEGLAEGIENAAGALPSAFVGTALNDQTWKGDPLSNLLVGTAIGVGMGVGLGAGMQGARGAYGALRTRVRLSTPEGRLAEANRILGDAYQQHRASNPDASHRDFLDSTDARRAQAEVEQRGLIGEQRAARAARQAEPDVAARGEAEAPPHAADEVARPVDEIPSLPPLQVAPPRPTEMARPARAQMPEVKSSVPGNEARLAAEAPAVRADEAGELAPRPDAEAPHSPESDEAVPSRPPATDPASQALRDGLPAALTDRVDVRVNPDLEGNTVRVIPDPQGGPRAGVRIEVGPDARPIDVFMHAHTVQSMQRYSGLLGRVRALRDWFYLTKVGSRGWEAKLESEKLPGIIHERMQRLSRGDLDLAAQARLLDEIDDLSRQFDGYQRVLESPSVRDSKGRGFVAAEKTTPQPPAEEATAIDSPAPRPELPNIRKKLKELPADQRQALEERMAALDDALRASDAERFRVMRDDIAGELGIPGDVLTEALYLPDALRPDWDASQLLPQDKQALAWERFLAEKNRRTELGARVAELKRRVSNEPIVRELVEGLARDLSLGDPDLIFNEMVDWIISKGRTVEARLDALTPQRRAAAREQIDLLQRLHAEHGSKSPEFERLAESLARELGLKRGVLEQEILPGYRGRRPGATRLVDILRGRAKERGVDLDGFVLRAALEENIGALATIRERLRTIQPDSILAVEKGGVFLADALAHGSPDIQGRVTRVPKADDNSRAPHMEAAIRDQIVNGEKTSFAIVDFYMGGGAAGEFLHMIGRILDDHPHVRFEIIWMRERHGFERLGDAIEDPGVRLLPFHETPDQLRGRVQQTSVDVRVVLGDDMKVVFGKSDTDVITIVDRYGRIIQQIPVGTRDPETGEPLSARQILIRLLNGVEFAEASR